MALSHCVCAAGAQQKAALAEASCLGSLAHAFRPTGPRSKVYNCAHCDAAASGQVDLARLEESPRPMLCCHPKPVPAVANSKVASTKLSADKVTTSTVVHQPVQNGNEWKCANCPLTSSTKASLSKFRKARCLGLQAHHCLQSSDAAPWICTKCGDTVGSAKQLQGKVTHPCPGASKLESTFQHQLSPEPDTNGKFQCKRCGRSTLPACEATSVA